jgi:hypothetical protein
VLNQQAALLAIVAHHAEALHRAELVAASPHFPLKHPRITSPRQLLELELEVVVPRDP